MMKFQNNDEFLKNELIIIEKDVGDKTCIFNIQNNRGYEVSDVSKYIWGNINVKTFL